MDPQTVVGTPVASNTYYVTQEGSLALPRAQQQVLEAGLQPPAAGLGVDPTTSVRRAVLGQ
jgi:hypothetical protein